MDYREKILEFIKANGPVLPVQIAKEIGSNILMASAHLAELTATHKLKISSIKVGGSPLYYLDGQEASLQKYTSSLNDKEKKAFDLLMQDKILKDLEQEPVIRVALRGIKDFAVPLNVNYNDAKEIFWKWHLTSDNEAEQLIKSKLETAQMNPLEAQPASEKKAEQESAQKRELKEETLLQSTLPAQKEQKAARKYRKTEKYEKSDRFLNDRFLNDINKFFGKNNINVISSELIKKNSEIDFIIEIPSVVGSLQYYCKAKDKKRISDSDLSNAYVKGQFKKLPVIFISSGELSAKAEEMIKKELSNLTFKKI